MIPGFNTDIVLNGVVYHIQTEDMGKKARGIVTQVFREGAVVFTRRTPYPSAVDKTGSEILLEKLVRSQHVKLLQFVRAGGLNKQDLLEEFLSENIGPEDSPARQAPSPQSTPVALPARQGPSPTSTPVALPPVHRLREDNRKTMSFGSPIVSALRQSVSKHKAASAKDKKTDPGDSTRFLGSESLRLESFKKDSPLEPSQSVHSSESSRQVRAESEKTGELVIEDFLRELADSKEKKKPETASDAEKSPMAEAPVVPPIPKHLSSEVDETQPTTVPEGEKCEIQLVSSATVRSGDVQPFSIRIQSDKSQIPIAQARVEIRIFGKTLRPISYIGRSDGRGLFAVEILVPHFTVGAGYLEVKAQTQIGERKLLLDVARSAS